MSSRTKQIIRATVGLTLAVALIGWGFPKFAKTNWTEVWIRVEAVSAWQALGFLGLVLVGLGCCVSVQVLEPFAPDDNVIESASDA